MMSVKDKRLSYGQLQRIESVYPRPTSMAIKFWGEWHEVGDMVDDILKGMGWYWEAEEWRYFEHYRGYRWHFSVGSVPCTLTVLTVERPSSGSKNETFIRIHLFVGPATKIRIFDVAYHPFEVCKSEIHLDDLLESSLRALFYVACDICRHMDLVHLTDDRQIIIYHDGRWVTRIDIIMRRSKVPYHFVISYHIDAPFVAVEYGIISKELLDFGVLKDAVVEEYWRQFVGGGDEG
jgi:hypothetical protein